MVSSEKQKDNLKKDQLKLAKQIMEDRIKDIDHKEKERVKSLKPQPTPSVASGGKPGGSSQGGKSGPSQNVDLPAMDLSSFQASNGNGGLTIANGKYGTSRGKTTSSGKTQSANGSTQNQPNMDSMGLQVYEKDKSMFLIHKLLTFCSEYMEEIDEALRFLQKHKWKQIRLAFNSPIVITMQGLAAFVQVAGMSEARVREIVERKAGIR